MFIINEFTAACSSYKKYIEIRMHLSLYFYP